MSYSETITKESLTNILNEVLPQSSYIQSWEYVGDVYWWGNTWTVPDDGFIEVYVEPSAANWYWRISDSKAHDTGWSHRLTGANGLTVSQEFFVKKGAVLGTYDMNAINTAHVYYYKFTLKETIPEPAVDYIVEQGTSGNWTYRKWNSGVAECWGRTSISGLTTNVKLPFTFANTNYETQVTLIANTNSATNVTAIVAYSSSVSIGVNTVPSGGARLFVIGRWK